MEIKGKRSVRRGLALLLAAALLCAGCSQTSSDVQTDAETGFTAEPESQTTDETAEEENPWDALEKLTLDTSPLEQPLALPSDSTVYSAALALQAQTLCAAQSREEQQSMLETCGFTLLRQVNFDKDSDSPAHSCAYSIARREIALDGEVRTLLAVVIRGTAGGEWYSNFDFAPSQSNDAVFAENFLLAAEEVVLDVQAVLAQEASPPLVLLCGHSRGAACANLAGLLLNAAYDARNVYAYTFASPGTIRSDSDADPGNILGIPCRNIFNVINAADIVPMTPLEGWGYFRAGTDVVLCGDEEKAAARRDAMQTLLELAPSVRRYYSDRHALDGAGLSENGVTAFELMLTLAQSLSGVSDADAARQESQELRFDALSEESDFAPLFDLLERCAEQDGALGADIVRQHMPAVYQALLAKAESEGEQ